MLKRRLLADGAADGARTRYFFHGLTEEVVKRSVAGAHADTAFELLTRENGETAAGWAVHDADPAGASVASGGQDELRLGAGDFLFRRKRYKGNSHLCQNLEM